MKLSLLFVSVLFIGTALAKDARQQNQADARLASNKHSRAQAVRRTCEACKSKREYSDDTINLILQCVGEAIRSITASTSESSAGDGIEQWYDIYVGICLQCSLQVSTGNGSDEEQEHGSNNSPSSEEHFPSTEHPKSSEEHHKSSEEHPKSSEEHPKSSEEKPNSNSEDDGSKKRHKSKRQKSHKSRSHHARARAAHKQKVL